MQKNEFYFGVGLENCWMAQHDPEIRPGKRLLDVFLQMDHYKLWEEDLSLAADLGVNAIRYSVPWYLSNPSPGKYDFKWIEKPLSWMKKRGITPVIDLLHYGTPLWMDNGILNHAFSSRLAEYASAFSEHFDGLVDHFTPHNEPQINAIRCGYLANWPPYLHGMDGWLRICLNAARSVVEVSQALRAADPNVTLISADACTAALPHYQLVEEFADAIKYEREGQPFSQFDLLMGYFPSTLSYGCIEVDSVIGRGLQTFGYSRDDLEWFVRNAERPDIFGVNYYPMGWPENTSDPKEKYNELEDLMSRTYQQFHLPIYITETSGGLNTKEKCTWLSLLEKLHGQMKIKEVPFVGMNWWPLYETIQWFYRDSTATIEECIQPGGWNNGLYSIESDSKGSLQRVPDLEFVADFKKLGRRFLATEK